MASSNSTPTTHKALEQEAAERYPITQNDANHFLFQTSQRKAYIAGRTASSNEVCKCGHDWNSHALHYGKHSCFADNCECEDFAAASSTISEGQGEEKELNHDEISKGDILVFSDGTCDIVKVTRVFKSSALWFVDWELLHGEGGFKKGNSLITDFYPIVLREKSESQLSEGTAKGGEDGLSKVMVDYYENKLESYQRIIDEQYQRIAELEQQLSSQEAQAIAEKAFVAGVARERYDNLTAGAKRFASKPPSMGEYLSQFSSTSSPVKQ